MNLDRFGMNTRTLAGPLEAKLRAVKVAGFDQIMLSAGDIVGHPDGDDAAIAAVLASGLRVTGFQVLRDFEGLSGHLHAYKIDVAKAMLEMCHAVGAKVLLVSSSTSTHASSDVEVMVADLRKLAMLAVPLGIRIAFEALSWGRNVNQYQQAWNIVTQADRANLGMGIDSFHIFASGANLDDLVEIDTERIFLVQLADFMWHEVPSFEERISTARHFRVFPGEGVHNDAMQALVQALDRNGYAGDYSFEVFNDDYVQMPLAMVTRRARRSVEWLASHLPRRTLPVRSTAAQRGGRERD